MNIRLKIICLYACEGNVVPSFVNSEDLMADIRTKSLEVPRIEELRKMLNLKATQADVEKKCLKTLFVTGC